MKYQNNQILYQNQGGMLGQGSSVDYNSNVGAQFFGETLHNSVDTNFCNDIKVVKTL